MARLFTARSVWPIAAALVLTGCSGAESSPGVAGSPSVSASSAPSPSQSAEASPEPLLPPILSVKETQPTKAGAIAFARFYWETVNYSVKAADPKPLRGLARPGCTQCSSGIKVIREFRADKAKVSGGSYQQARSTAQRQKTMATDLRFVVTTKVDRSPQNVDYPAPRKDRRFNGGPAKIDTMVDWVDGGWLITYWDIR